MEERKTLFKGYREEIDSFDRSLPVVVKIYQTAIKTANLLAKVHHSVDHNWYSITLKLTLAEVLIKAGKPNQAAQTLRQIRSQVQDLFDNINNYFIKFRAGRLIVLIALYFKDHKGAKASFDFFLDFQKNTFPDLKYEEQTLFMRIHNELKYTLKNKEKYSKEQLNGFTINV